MKIFRLRRAARWRLLRRRVFDWPSIFIAFSGVALWMLWPNNISSISVIPQLQEPMVSFVSQNSSKHQLIGSPTVFALPSIYGFNAIDNNIGMPPDVKDVWYNSSPHYLARNIMGDNDDKISELLSIETGHHQNKKDNNRFRIEENPIFTAVLNNIRKINIVYYGELRKYKFEVPEIDTRLFDKEKSWIIRLLVQIDKAGYPNQVFIEKGSNIPEVDAEIIRLVNQGKLKLPGKSCEGRITVNFGL